MGLILLLAGELNLDCLLCTVRKNVLQLVFTLSHCRAVWVLAIEMNCVKFTLRGTYTTSKTLVHIHNRGSASKASCRLRLHLLLGKYKGRITEGS